MSTTENKPRSILEVAQHEMVMRDKIAEVLNDEPKTIPEIAAILNYPVEEITVWLFGMRRYSMVEETGRADIDGYFKYELLEQNTNEEGNGS